MIQRVLLSLVLLSGTTAFASDGECEGSLPTASAMIERLRNRAPDLLRQGAMVREALAKVLQVQDRTNPIASVQGLRSTPEDPSGDSVQASLIFPTDVWGVRSSRKQKAEIDATASKLNQSITDDQVSIAGYLAIVQVQLLEKSILNDVAQIRILKTTIQSYTKRPSLTPEQEAILGTLEIALADQEMKVEIDHQDQEGLVHDLSIMMGCSWSLKEALSIVFMHDWPNLEVADDRLNLSPHFARYAVMRDQADLEIQLSNRELKPAISIGPALEWTRIRNESGFRVGVAMQMPLPIFESYSGHRAAAQATASRLRDDAEAGLRETKGELEHSLEIYRSAALRLRLSKSQELKPSRSLKILRSFERGLVSGGMLLESLRSERERLASNLTLELRARSARCKVLAFQKRVEECYK